jgi:pyruvate dehydrogenase E2 component (dihydrolipoyllysine-residue acetyltransferase)
MPADVIMPALGMAQETGKVLRWLKAEGDVVAKGEPLLEIETDKVTVEVESPAAGTLAGIRAAEGEDVPVGQAIAVVLAEGETPAVAPVTSDGAEAQAPVVSSVASDGGPASAPPRRRLASPKARRLAAEHGIDIDALVGSGPQGAVVAADIEAAAPAQPVPSNRLLLGEEAAGIATAAGIEVGSVWRVMAERTARSWQTVPHFFLEREVEATRLNSWREAARRRPGSEHVSHTDLLVKVAAEALRRHPRVNSSWHDGTIVPGPGINVAIAVATDEALVAPVVHGADELGLAQIAERRRAVVEAARAGKLRPDDVQGGTFTISNLGMYGVDAFSAIVNAPQAAILAVGRIADRVVAVDGHAVVRPMLVLTLSLDHRVVDGARGAEFLDTLASLIEEPAGLVP